MKKFIDEVKTLAEKISLAEEKRKKLANFLREANSEIKIIYPVKQDPLNDIKVVGIDGGISKKSLHGFDFMLIRTAGTLFRYKEGKFIEVEYFPSRLPNPKPFIMEALSDLDWAHSTSIERQNMEVETAIKCMEKFNPDIILMDGSIVPYYSERPAKKSTIYKRYLSMIENYKKLYSKAIETNTILAGVIEDSRGSMFCDIVKNILSNINHPAVPELAKILDRTRDTNLLYWALRKGERSEIFRYAETPSEHPILKEIPEFAEKIYTFYLKTAKFDRPVRVDVLGKDSIEKLASVILSISGQHSGYGIPVPLIEADNIVKLSDKDVDFFYSQVMSHVGNLPGIMKLRREQRPF